MRPFTSTIPLDEARRRLMANVRPIGRSERVALSDAAGRVAARDVVSPLDVPPFARSAMDGYAVIAADTGGSTRTTPARLRVVDRVYTGEMPRASLQPGTCAEIATGAPVPAGADAVVMVEETERVSDRDVNILVAASAGQNVSPRGGDIVAGARVVAAGDALGPGRIGSLAAVGRADVEVFARPHVSILSTGNEVIPPGHSLAPGQIYDVNRFTLAAVVGAHGGVADARAAVHDSLDRLLEALESCAQSDVIVFSGGSSVGERDLIVDVVSAARGEMIFHGIAIKPGKPTAFALIRGTPFFGMPGNPTSCLSNAYILLVPFLRATARLPPFAPRVVRVPVGRRIASPAGRHQIYTVRLSDGAAYPAFKGSGDITSLSQADGYIDIPPDRNVIDEGTLVDVTLF
jgi:molybdenum cofactor synthesis domain-containing protein